MKKSLSKTLFNRQYTIPEWVVTIAGLSAATITIFQNLLPQTTLAAGIESSITKSPTNIWMLGLGVLILLLIFKDKIFR